MRTEEGDFLEMKMAHNPAHHLPEFFSFTETQLRIQDILPRWKWIRLSLAAMPTYYLRRDSTGPGTSALPPPGRRQLFLCGGDN